MLSKEACSGWPGICGLSVLHWVVSGEEGRDRESPGLMLLSGGRAGSSHLSMNQVQGVMSVEQGGQSNLSGWCLGPQADALRLRAGGLRSPGCWEELEGATYPQIGAGHYGSSCKALRLQMESLLPFLSTGVTGCLGSLARWLVCVRVCSRVTQSRPAPL